jgi:hypothetical protein
VWYLWDMLATQSPDAEGDSTDAAPFQELKRNLTAALQLSMQLGEGRGKQWEAHARQLRKFIEFVDEEHTASIDGCLIPIGAEQASRFAQLLLAKRQSGPPHANAGCKAGGRIRTDDLEYRAKSALCIA